MSQSCSASISGTFDKRVDMAEGSSRTDDDCAARANETNSSTETCRLMAAARTASRILSGTLTLIDIRNFHVASSIPVWAMRRTSLSARSDPRLSALDSRLPHRSCNWVARFTKQNLTTDFTSKTRIREEEKWGGEKLAAVRRQLAAISRKPGSQFSAGWCSKRRLTTSHCRLRWPSRAWEAMR